MPVRTILFLIVIGSPLWSPAIGLCQSVLNGVEVEPIDFRNKKSIRDFYASKSLAQLANLKHSDEPSVAMYAARYFFEDQGKHNTGKYQESGGPEILVDSFLQRKVRPSDIEFAGYLSGFLGVDLPDWWRALIINPYENHIMLKSYGFVRSFNCYHQDRLMVSEMLGNRIKGKLRTGGEEQFVVMWDLEVPQEDVDQLWYPGSVGSFDIISVDGNRFIYATSHKEMAVSRIYCSGRMGDVIWKNDSSESATPGGNISFLHTHAELRIKDDRVLLFSSTCCDTFLDIFEIETGKRIGGFSTMTAKASYDIELED